MARTSVEIVFGLFDVTAKDDSTVVMSDNMAFAVAQDLAAEIPTPAPVATLEPDFWALDGSLELFPNNPANYHWGIWSQQMSDTSGHFAPAPQITVNFTQNHTSIGITLYFYGDCYASSVLATWYNAAGGIISSGVYTPNSMTYFINNNVVDYRKVVLVFSGTSKPSRYLRIYNIEYGALRVFGRNDLISAGISEAVNPLSAEININTLSFQAHSDDDDFNIINPAGVYAVLQQRQPLTVYKIIDGEKQQIGIYYLDEWKNISEKTVSMTAVDILGIIDGTPFAGGTYTNKPLPALMSEIFADTRAAYELDSSFSGILITGKLDPVTCREALQQVAFVIGATVDVGRQNIVSILPMPTGTPSQTIPNGSKFLGQKITLLPLITGVEVTAHSYVGDTDTQTVYGYYDTNLPAGAKQNIISVTDATLAHAGNAAAIAKRIYDYYQHRHKNEFEIILDAEQAGQLITAGVYNGAYLAGIVESVNINLTGGMRGKITLVGTPVEV